jgi:hypothetical protein
MRWDSFDAVTSPSKLRSAILPATKAPLLRVEIIGLMLGDRCLAVNRVLSLSLLTPMHLSNSLH